MQSLPPGSMTYIEPPNAVDNAAGGNANNRVADAGSIVSDLTFNLVDSVGLVYSTRCFSHTRNFTSLAYRFRRDAFAAGECNPQGLNPTMMLEPRQSPAKNHSHANPGPPAGFSLSPGQLQGFPTFWRSGRCRAVRGFQRGRWLDRLSSPNAGGGSDTSDPTQPSQCIRCRGDHRGQWQH